MNLRLTFAGLLCLMLLSASAQRDSIIFKNKNAIVGQVLNLEKGVATIKTPYSDQNFKIKWNRVEEIYTESYFLVSLSDGSRYNGTLRSGEERAVYVLTEDAGQVRTTMREVVYLLSVDRTFWSRISISIGVGFNLTKANSFQQFNTRSSISYLADRSGLDVKLNAIQSTQDNAEAIRRFEGSVNYRFFLPQDWYGFVQPNFLSNTEQKLKLRTNLKTGAGKFLKRSNSDYIGLSAGVNLNNENFDETGETAGSDRQSWEGFAGAEMNLFNIGKLSLLTTANFFPGITERGRYRIDHRLDIKYDLLLDFYIKMGYTVNYDNQPVEGATDLDYVVQTTFGWDF